MGNSSQPLVGYARQGHVATITLSRPENRLRVEGEHSDGTKVLTVFNGKEITLVDSRSNVYATAPQTGSLDDTIIYFVRDLGMRLPLGPYQALEEKILILKRKPGVDNIRWNAHSELLLNLCVANRQFPSGGGAGA